MILNHAAGTAYVFSLSVIVIGVASVSNVNVSGFESVIVCTTF